MVSVLVEVEGSPAAVDVGNADMDSERDRRVEEDSTAREGMRPAALAEVVQGTHSVHRDMVREGEGWHVELGLVEASQHESQSRVGEERVPREGCSALWPMLARGWTQGQGKVHAKS